MRDMEFVTLVKIYRLLWLAIPLLVAIAFHQPRRLWQSLQLH